MQFVNTLILYIEKFIDLDSVLTVLLNYYGSVGGNQFRLQH